MSTSIPAPAPPTVLRSHSTSARAHSSSASYRPTTASDFPHRTRSVAARPSTSASTSPQQQGHLPPAPPPQSHYAHARAQSYDRRAHPHPSPAAPDSVARQDFEAASRARPTSSRRESAWETSESAAYRSDSVKKQYQRVSATPNHQRTSVDMPAATATLTEAPPHIAPASSTQPRKRPTISTPTGQWALGKTIGAGSMGKVKLAKNLETGEQVLLHHPTRLLRSQPRMSDF